MEREFYSKLESLVSKDRVGIKLIVAPPRTGSTLLESIMANSPTVDVVCHEPFLRFGYTEDSPDVGYKNIFESIESQRLNDSSTKVSVVVKELSHRLSLGNEYLRLSALSNDPVTFLIRNPLLMMESRIKKVIETVSRKVRTSTLNWLSGQLFNRIGQPLLVANVKSQEFLLNSYARKIGYHTWNGLVDQSFSDKNYRVLEGFLQGNLARLAIDLSGPGSMEGQINNLEGLNKKVVVIDSTEFRLDPEHILLALCLLWSIEYSDRMIYWGNRKLKLVRGKEKVIDHIWYDSLANSRTIKYPTETPPHLDSFPSFIQQHLTSHDIPQYARLFDHPGHLKGRDSLVGKNMEGIDPIYSVLRNPQLLNDSDYMLSAKAYKDVITVIKAVKSNKGGF